MIEVGRFVSRTQAESARSLLAAAGIPCILAPDAAFAASPIDLSGGACLLVAEADAPRAAEILEHCQPTHEGRR
jgi:Putative prokaryotic signal transducing protein